LERDVESLLAAERLPVAVPRDTLHNALRRARIAVHQEGHSHVVRVGRRPEPRRVAKLIAVPIALGASWALAHRAGYPVQFWASEAPSAVEQREGSFAAERPARGSQSRAALESPAESKSTTAQTAQPQANPAPPEAAPQGANGEPVPGVNSAPQEARVAAPSNGTSTFSSNAKPADESTRELAMLQLAQRAVARRQYSAALARIAEHRKAFPSGALSEEREALRIKALVGLGKAGEARQAAGDFKKKFPNSALQGRIHVPPQTSK
jgi:hypothetical protein